MSQFGWIVRVFCLLCLLVSGAGCKKELDTPHIFDPIYRDIARELKEYKEAVVTEQAKLAELREELKTADIQTVDAKLIKSDIKRSVEKLERYEQLIKYYDIRERRRKVEANISYRLARRQKREWPDPEEYKHYKTNKKLIEAPRSWQSRVPKLFETPELENRQPANR